MSYTLLLLTDKRDYIEYWRPEACLALPGRREFDCKDTNIQTERVGLRVVTAPTPSTTGRD